MTQTNFALHTSNQNVSPNTGAILGSIPRPYVPVAGRYLYDNAGAIGNYDGNGLAFGSNSGIPYTTFTGSTGDLYLTNYRLNAAWNYYWNWPAGCLTNAMQFPYLPNYQYYGATDNFNQNGSKAITCVTYGLGHAIGSPGQFSLDSAPPSTLADQADTALSGTANVQLYLYGRDGTLAAQPSAIGVAPDQVTATYPFPSLSPGLYGTAIIDVGSGQATYAGGGHFLSVGHSDNSFPKAFGVAAGSYTSSGYDCTTSDPYNDGTYAGGTSCYYQPNVNENFPIVSLYDSGQLKWNGNLANVGYHPTVVLGFGSFSNDDSYYSPGESYDYSSSGTQSALVVNTGSNSVSIVDLPSASVTNIGVGNQPVAAQVSGDYAYIANSGDSTVSKVSLISMTVVNTGQLSFSPTALDVDGSGVVWVGGGGSVASLDPNSLAVTTSQSVPGSLLALGVSSDLNKVMTQSISGVGTGSGAYANATTTVATMPTNTSGSYTGVVSQSAAPYGTSAEGPGLINPAQLGSAVVVSGNFGNALAVSATPTGFVVVDVQGGSVLLTGTTPGPVRSIGVDPGYAQVYMTIPSTDAVITVPLPDIPY